MISRLLLVILLLGPPALATAGSATMAEAIAAKRAGEHEKAITLLQALAAQEPGNAEILFHLGSVQGWTGRHDEALRTFERALEIAPQDADLRLGYGRVLAWSGRHERAEKIFRRILAMQPDNLEALNMLGRVLAWQRQLDAAGEVFTNILQSAPSNTDALIGLGDVERLQERFPEASALYERALAIEPGSADIAGRVGNVRRLGRWRLDAGMEISAFSGDTREDWRGINAALRYTVDRRTGINASAEHVRRFGLTDVHYALGADRRFADTLNGQLRFGVTPSADFLARHALSAGLSWRWREASERTGPTLLLADYRHSRFAPGSAHSLWLGLTHYVTGRIALTAKGLGTRNLNGDTTGGWQLRVDHEPSDSWRWYLGYADAHESMSSTVFDFTSDLRTRSLFGGVYHEFSLTRGLRVDLTYEDTVSLPARRAFHVGIVTRF